MLFFVSLIPATVAVVVGYFVLFSSARSEGSMRRFGQLLAAWLFLLAGVVVLAGALAPMVGLRSPVGEMMQHMQRMEEQNEAILEELRED